MTYRAPLDDMRFALGELAGLDRLLALAGGGADRAAVDDVLEAAGRFAADVLAPLDRTGDLEGATLANGAVRAPRGFADAYRRFVEDGWNALPGPADHGGSGLPRAVASAAAEMWSGANMAFALCPLLTHSAVELLVRHGTPAQRERYLANLVSGRWAGTMVLTEPQAGSDVGALTTRAARAADGTYRITGSKIFITYGDHDMAENIVHFVLARVAGAPPGPKGVSLFIAPRLVQAPDGRWTRRNALGPVRLEKKLGIRGSPTCEMAFDGAEAEIVGAEGQGLAGMFAMMNTARHAVGLEGIAVGEAALQQAAAYARERVQGRDAEGRPTAIENHPDVRRMLLVMRAEVEAMRGLAYVTAARHDAALHAADAGERAEAQAFVDLMTPVVKACGSDMGFRVASEAVQVHGGLGFIEDTGAAQRLRDARIAMIYEGTNGIQAIDLVRRKLGQDGGRAARAFLDTVAALDDGLAAVPEFAALRLRLGQGAEALAGATRWMTEALGRDADDALAGASDYLRLFGVVAGGWIMAKAALAARARLAEGAAAPLAPAVYRAKLTTARNYAERVLPAAAGLAAVATAGAASLRQGD